MTAFVIVLFITKQLALKYDKEILFKIALICSQAIFFNIIIRFLMEIMLEMLILCAVNLTLEERNKYFYTSMIGVIIFLTLPILIIVLLIRKENRPRMNDICEGLFEYQGIYIIYNFLFFGIRVIVFLFLLLQLPAKVVCIFYILPSLGLFILLCSHKVFDSRFAQVSQILMQFVLICLQMVYLADQFMAEPTSEQFGFVFIVTFFTIQLIVATISFSELVYTVITFIRAKFFPKKKLTIRPRPLLPTQED